MIYVSYSLSIPRRGIGDYLGFSLSIYIYICRYRYIHICTYIHMCTVMVLTVGHGVRRQSSADGMGFPPLCASPSVHRSHMGVDLSDQCARCSTHTLDGNLRVNRCRWRRTSVLLNWTRFLKRVFCLDGLPEASCVFVCALL